MVEGVSLCLANVLTRGLVFISTRTSWLSWRCWLSRLRLPQPLFSLFCVSNINSATLNRLRKHSAAKFAVAGTSVETFSRHPAVVELLSHLCQTVQNG